MESFNIDQSRKNEEMRLCHEKKINELELSLK